MKEIIKASGITKKANSLLKTVKDLVGTYEGTPKHLRTQNLLQEVTEYVRCARSASRCRSLSGLFDKEMDVEVGMIHSGAATLSLVQDGTISRHIGMEIHVQIHEVEATFRKMVKEVADSQPKFS